jgi:GNAT superfamily N-acetyltransferase
LRFYRTTPDAWPMFARHHYLSGGLNRSAHCYVGWLELQRTRLAPRDDRHHAERDEYAVAFCGVLNAIGRRGLWRVSRIVVLPDYQGIGVGRAMLRAVAGLYPRLRITTGHPAMLRALAADPEWRLAALRRAGYSRQTAATQHAGFHGGTIAATSAGRCVGTFEWKPSDGSYGTYETYGTYGTAHRSHTSHASH